MTDWCPKKQTSATFCDNTGICYILNAISKGAAAIETLFIGEFIFKTTAFSKEREKSYQLSCLLINIKSDLEKWPQTMCYFLFIVFAS